MSLPILQHPTFEVVIPSTSEKKRFRPFTVAEEKVLLIAREEADGNIPNAVALLCEIMRNCCSDTLDTSKLATFDVEYIFVKLREHSVGDIIKLDYGTGKAKKQIEVSLKDLRITIEHKQEIVKVASNEQVQIVLGFPTFESVAWIESATDEQTKLVRNLASVIKAVIDGEETLDTSGAPDDDMLQFINSLPLETMNAITSWIERLPYVYIPIKLPSGKTQEIRGLDDFFRT